MTLAAATHGVSRVATPIDRRQDAPVLTGLLSQIGAAGRVIGHP